MRCVGNSLASSLQNSLRVLTMEAVQFAMIPNTRIRMTDPWRWIDDELQALDRQALRRRRRTVTPLAGGRCLIDGRELLNFASNDYLDLAHDPRVVAAARTVLDRAGA